MTKKCVLPSNFNITAYLRAFKTLAPISGVTEGMTDDMVTYTANCAFVEHCEKLRKSGTARKEGNMWIILNSEKEHLVHMNILLIAIHSGANVAFTDSLES